MARRYQNPTRRRDILEAIVSPDNPDASPEVLATIEPEERDIFAPLRAFAMAGCPIVLGQIVHYRMVESVRMGEVGVTTVDYPAIVHKVIPVPDSEHPNLGITVFSTVKTMPLTPVIYGEKAGSWHYAHQEQMDGDLPERRATEEKPADE